MDIDDIRRANIRHLEHEAGSPAAAADRVGMTYVQYVNLRDGAKHSETGKPRGMRKTTAWRFEDAFGRPRGWLDSNHDAHTLQSPAAPYIVRPRHPSALIQSLTDLAEQISDEGLRELVGFAKCLTSTHPAHKAKRKSSA